MIKIFNATDTDFSSGGNIIIEPTKCREFKKKSLNGWYIEVEVPIKYKDYIKEDNLVVVQTKSKVNPQAFRITEDLQINTRNIKFTANHVMFDSARYFLLDVRPTNLNGLNGLNYINQRTDKISPFKIYSDVENVSTAYFIRKNLFEAWQVFEERWNGVFDADNWDVSFLQSIGNDNGESIIYGKNAQSVEIYEDWSNVVTRIYPVGYDGIMLPEIFLESDIQYEIPYTKKIDFETNLEEEERTEEKLIEELRKNANRYLEENKTPQISYTVRSDINNKMEIGDSIQILHPLVSIKTEAIEYEYDLILKKIRSITFGNYSRDVKTKFTNIRNTINQITETVSKQEAVINTQTNLINSLNKNGYVYIDDNEILILDRIPKEEAQNVWRWGLGGLGFSSNGYEGPFETAITIDGQINARFITTGELSVSRIAGLANKLTEYDRNIAEINIELGRIESSISEIADITISKESTTGFVSFEQINESEPIRIEVHPINESISYLYPNTGLFSSLETFLKVRTLRFTRTYEEEENGQTVAKIETIDYELPDDLLYYDEENYDEFILDYNTKMCIINKKVGYNADGTTYLLEESQTIICEYPTIQLENGNYDVSLLGYSAAYLFVRLMTQNIYTEQFATRAEMNSAITQTKDEISLNVTKKLSNYYAKDEVDSAIEITADGINIRTREIYETKEDIEEKINALKTATIKNVDVQYALGTSTTTAPTTGWSTTAPEWEDGKYMWQRTVTTYGNNMIHTSNPTCIAGATGDTGIGVRKIIEQYYLSTSNTTQTGGSWKETQDNWEEGKYIWTRSKITWTDNNNTYTEPILATAINNANEIANFVEAQLGTKVGRNENGQIVSMLNASANEINIHGNRFVLDSDNFKVSKEGDITATSGTIGGFTLGENSFEADLVSERTAYAYTSSDLNRIQNIILGNIIPTTNDYNKYDFNNSGTIDFLDYMIVRNIISGYQLTTKTKFELNTKTSEKAITIKKQNNVILSLGEFGSYIKYLTVDHLNSKNSLRANGEITYHDDENNIDIRVGLVTLSDGTTHGRMIFSQDATNTIYMDSKTGEIFSTGVVQAKGFQVGSAGTTMYGRDVSHYYQCHWTGSQLQFYVDGTNVGTLSDKRLKTEIENIDEDFINIINEIEMKQFKIDNRNGLVSFGILAQDLIKIFKKYNKDPFDYEIVQKTQYKMEDEKVYYTINYEQFLILKQKATDIKLKALEEKDKKKDEIIADLIKRIETLEKEER